MGKVFTYYVQSSPEYYSEETDETFCDEDSFEYEVDWDDITDALADMIYDDYFKNIPVDKETKKLIIASIYRFIGDQDLEDTLMDCYEDALKDCFEEEAMEAYRYE